MPAAEYSPLLAPKSGGGTQATTAPRRAAPRVLSRDCCAVVGAARHRWRHLVRFSHVIARPCHRAECVRHGSPSSSVASSSFPHARGGGGSGDDRAAPRRTERPVARLLCRRRRRVSSITSYHVSSNTPSRDCAIARRPRVIARYRRRWRRLRSHTRARRRRQRRRPRRAPPRRASRCATVVPSSAPRVIDYAISRVI